MSYDAIYHNRANKTWTSIIITVLFSILLSVIIILRGHAVLFIPFLVILTILAYKHSDLLPNFIICFSLFSSRGDFLGGLGYWELIVLMLFLFWSLKRKFKRNIYMPFYGKITFYCILGYCSILISHYIANRLGVGYGSEGGLRLTVISGMLITISYLIHNSMIRLKKPELIPYIGLIPGFFLLAIEITNIIFPKAIFTTYQIYNNINWESIRSFSTLGQYKVLRLSGLRDFGFYLALFCAASIYHSRRKIDYRKISMFAISFVCIICSGYRGYVISFIIIFYLILWIKSKKHFIRITSLGFIFVIALVLTQSFLIKLPYSFQRSLSWLPVNWDVEVKNSVESGFIWRKELIDIYMQVGYVEHKWFGQGLRFFSDEIGFSDHTPFNRRSIEDFARDQSFHSGFFTTLDIVGLVGFLFLFVAIIRSYYNCFILIKKREYLKPWMIWIMLFYLSTQIPFWIAGFFQKQIIQITICLSTLELIRFNIDQADREEY